MFDEMILISIYLRVNFYRIYVRALILAKDQFLRVKMYILRDKGMSGRVFDFLHYRKSNRLYQNQRPSYLTSMPLLNI